MRSVVGLLAAFVGLAGCGSHDPSPASVTTPTTVKPRSAAPSVGPTAVTSPELPRLAEPASAASQKAEASQANESEDHEEFASVRRRFERYRQVGKAATAGAAFQELQACYAAAQKHGGNAKWDQLGREIESSLDSLADEANSDAATELGQDSVKLILK